MQIKIVDTTLRDGEQKAGIALGIKEKVEIAKMLDSIGIDQIEAGTPAMGGSEKKSIEKIVSLGLKCKVSSWNRMNTEDIQHSLDCGVDIVHISVPTSDIQISTKLNKDRSWVLDNMKRSIYYATKAGSTVTVGMEDASRANFRFILDVAQTALNEGVHRVRYADTVGILNRHKAYDEIQGLRNRTGTDIEIHAHNDVGMAVANSLWAAKAGAEYVNCTIGGIGERAGNCDFIKFVQAERHYLGKYKNVNLEALQEIQMKILQIFYQLP